MYRIIISTPEHGTILDQDVAAFLLIRRMLCEHNDPTHELETRIDSRGVSEYEQVGLLEWAKVLTTGMWVEEAGEGPGLADHPD